MGAVSFEEFFIFLFWPFVVASKRKRKRSLGILILRLEEFAEENERIPYVAVALT